MSAKTKKRAKIKYTWRPGTRAKVPAQVAGEELERIARENGDELRPAVVVEESRPEDAPLHPAFTWDDEEAARKWREDEARGLIRSVRVVTVGGDGGNQPETRIGFIAVRTDPDESRCYVDSVRVMDDPDLRKQAMAEALGLLRGVRNRYAQLSELSGVWDAIDEIDRAG